MTKTQSQKGFGAVGTVAVVLVIAVLAFTGWYVWQKNNKKDDTSKPNGQTSQNQNGDPKKPDEQKPVDPSEGGKYLVIAEWGVRLPLAESLRGDVNYGIQTFASDNTQTASFEVGSLAKLPQSNCKLRDEPNGSGKSGGIGVYLVRTGEPLSATDAKRFSSIVPQIGGYWYYVGPQKGSCVGGEENEQLQLDAADGLVTGLTKLEAVR